MKTAQIGNHVSIQYEGMLENGEIVERSVDTGPVEFEIGLNIMPPAFEQALIGMREGEEKTITMTPEEAFGPRDENLLHTIKKKVLGEKIEPKPGMVLGMTLEKDEQPHKVPALVTAVNGDEITIDFNHPLAGKTVIYRLILKTIKD
ncbi:MAG: FKBP-type peptidyl-prolyl cis-trans isomerase [Desulfobulbales bacterium]